MILYFDIAQDAKLYRDKTGCGGWVFEADNGTAALFPASYTPSSILKHHVTKSLNGRLI
jgi:hypothetical protein